MNENLFTIQSEDGKTINYEKLITFYNEETKKYYVVYHEPNMSELLLSEFLVHGDDVQLLPIQENLELERAHKELEKIVANIRGEEI